MIRMGKCTIPIRLKPSKKNMAVPIPLHQDRELKRQSPPGRAPWFAKRSEATTLSLLIRLCSRSSRLFVAANAVTTAMELDDVKYAYTGGVDGGRGWKGDVRVMLLSIEKLAKLGWEPEFTSEESIEMTAQDVLRDFF